jgi:hypothetical protein
MIERQISSIHHTRGSSTASLSHDSSSSAQRTSKSLVELMVDVGGCATIDLIGGLMVEDKGVEDRMVG